MATVFPPAGSQVSLGGHQSWSREALETLILAWPLILTNLVELALTTTNLILVGELGSQAIAAVTLANNLFFFFAIIGLGVVTAVAPMVASALGAGDDSGRDIRRTVQQGLWTSLIVSIPGLAWRFRLSPLSSCSRRSPPSCASCRSCRGGRNAR